MLGLQMWTELAGVGWDCRCGLGLQVCAGIAAVGWDCRCVLGLQVWAEIADGLLPSFVHGSLGSKL